MNRLVTTARALIVFTLFWVVVAAAGCGDDDAPSSGEPPQQVQVTTSDLLAYDPEEITVKVGRDVILRLDSSGSSTMHDFSIEDIDARIVSIDEPEPPPDHEHPEGLDLHVMTEPGGTSTVRFTPKEAGTYRFYCTVPGHAQAGMTGVLIVEPATP